ncbi:Hypothetical predicted protein [Xyrichtys novacula]|uniref:Uncharacterized protein n=1 Tax=Xyrichtys novacula TaxID=13765 RepID=A0AAV1FFB6_XYRNO|nr:Hypothetical predicted protein [Xyrichtys novacula]
MWATVLNNKAHFSVRAQKKNFKDLRYKDGASPITDRLTAEQTNTPELTDGVQSIDAAVCTAGQNNTYTHTHTNRQARPLSYCLHAGSAELLPPPHALDLHI